MISPQTPQNPPTARRSRLRSAAGPLTLVLLAALSAACRETESRAPARTPEIAKVEQRDLRVQAEASGVLEPLRVVEVKSKVGGELLKINVETGDEVTQGTVLAQVDPRDVRTAFEQNTADQAVARAQLETAAAQHRRAKELAKAGLLSRQDLESRALEEANARAALLKAETSLTLAREKTGDVTIRAPITGTVIEKTVEQGVIIASASANVSGGTTLVKMADLGVVRARALIDEVDIGQIRAGQPALVTVEAYPNRTFRGVVTKVEPQAVVDQNVTMFPVLVELDNPEKLLRPGMNAEISIQIADRRDVVAVPNGAVVAPREAANVASVLGLRSEAVREQLRGARGGGQGADGGGRGRGSRPDRAEGAASGGAGARGAVEPAAAPGPGPQARPDDGSRPGVVFVKGPSGPEAKPIRIGLSDLDYTEVVSGLAPGTEVYLISVARLARQQESQDSRMRERMGGGMMGMGGGQRGGSGGGQRGGAGASGGGGRQ